MPVARKQRRTQPADHPPPLAGQLLTRLVRSLAIAAGLYFLVGRYLVDTRSTDIEKRQRLALDQAQQVARERMNPSPPDDQRSNGEITAKRGCNLRIRRVVEGHAFYAAVLDIAAIVDHAELLDLSDEQQEELNRRREECEQACMKAASTNANEFADGRLADHARRVLDALTLLNEKQRKLVDEWLGGDTLTEALSTASGGTGRQ